MSQRLVGIETFSVAKSKADVTEGFCSLIFGKRQTVTKDGKSFVPSGEPFSSLFLRCAENQNDREISTRQQIKREGRSISLPRADEGIDESVAQALSSLQLPKLGMETLENQIATLYALDQDVKDFTLLVHAIQVLATMQVMKSEGQLGHRYVCATEFKTPVKRSLDPVEQQPPVLEMQLWNAKAAADYLNQALIQPLGKAWQPYQLKQKISTAQQRLKQAQVAGDEQKVKELTAKIADYEKREQAAAEKPKKPTNIFERLLRDLDLKQIQVQFSAAKGSRYTPAGGLILSTDSDKSETPYLSQRIALTFQDWKPYQLYINELETGTGRLHYKKTAVHHIEHLRSEDVKDVLKVFAEYLCFDLSEGRRDLLVDQVASHLKLLPENREEYGDKLSEHANRLYEMFQQYNLANTVTPYAAFATQTEWEKEFGV